MRNTIQNINYRLIIFTLIISLAAFSFAQQNNLFTVEKNVTGNAQKFAEKNNVEYTIIENNSKKYSINIVLDYDVSIPELKVFNDGACVLINSLEGELTFFNNKGREIFKANILKGINVEYERSIYSSISKEFVVIALSQPDKEYSLIRIYTNQGQIINNFEVHQKHINGLFYSSDANLIALSVYNWENENPDKSTLFYNNSGVQISNISFNFTKGSITEGKNIFIGYTNNECFVYNVTDDTINFHTAVLKDAMILTVELMDDGIIIVDAAKPYLEKGKWYFKNPSFTHYNLSGTLITKRKEKSQPFSDFKLYKNNSNLIFQTENNSIQIN